MRTPADCHTKQDIRDEIDRLDRELIALLAERFAYVRRMAEIKQAPAEAHAQDRIDDVLDKVSAKAEAAGLDGSLIRAMWRSLIDWNVEYERRTIAARKPGDPSAS
jgi:isochorismate pyruvate lyase